MGLPKINLPKSSEISPPFELKESMNESKKSFYDLAKSRVRYLNSKKFSDWVYEVTGNRDLEKGIALNLNWPKIIEEDGIEKKIVENLEIVVNKDTFHLDGIDYKDIIPFVVEHEIYESWLSAKKGILGERFDRDDINLKHQLALRREIELAEGVGLAEKLIEWISKVRPDQESEYREVLEIVRRKTKKTPR